jgi:hypothetical protein
MSDAGKGQCLEGENCDTGNSKGCADVVPADVCAEWAAKGHCNMYRNQMGQYCRKTCDYCGSDTSSSYYEDKRKKGKAGVLSLWESRTKDTTYCDDAENRDLKKAMKGMCKDLEDESKVGERGFFVLRNFVPPDELQVCFMLTRSSSHLNIFSKCLPHRNHCPNQSAPCVGLQMCNRRNACTVVRQLRNSGLKHTPNFVQN